MEINPYQPPKAKIEDQTMQTNGGTYANKRPVLVWVIFVWSILAILGVLLSYSLIYVFHIPLSEQQSANVKNISNAEHLLTFIAIVLFFAGALALFLRRRVTIPLFIARLVMVTGVNAYYSFFRDGATTAKLSGIALLKPGVSILMAGIFLYYAIYLKKKSYYR